MASGLDFLFSFTTNLVKMEIKSIFVIFREEKREIRFLEEEK